VHSKTVSFIAKHYDISQLQALTIINLIMVDIISLNLLIWI